MSELSNRLRVVANEIWSEDEYRAGPRSLLIQAAADRIDELEPKARCDYIFSCGCRCQLDQHLDERHER